MPIHKAGLILIVAAGAIFAEPAPFGKRLKRFGLLSAGAACAVACMAVLMFFWGSVREMVFWSIEYGLHYTEQGSLILFWPRFCGARFFEIGQ